MAFGRAQVNGVWGSATRRWIGGFPALTLPVLCLAGHPPGVVLGNDQVKKRALAMVTSTLTPALVRCQLTPGGMYVTRLSCLLAQWLELEKESVKSSPSGSQADEAG